MKSSERHRWWLIVAMLLTASLRAEVHEMGEIAAARILVEVPAGWVAEPHISPMPGMISMKLSLGEGPDAVVHITVLEPTAEATLTPGNRDELFAVVSEVARSAGEQSVEGELSVEAFSLGPVQGFFFSATDKDPPADEYRFMSQGMGWMGPLAVSFTALSNVDPIGAWEVTRAAVSSIRTEEPR